MTYLSQSLTFESNKITFQDSWGDTFEVMMDWEDTLMSASAAYVCEGGGDILEIGFGMGISADYIQTHTINSHTIIENHPDIITKAQEWAADKSNVTIVEGDWYDVKGTLSTYDGVFYDTYGDDNSRKFSGSLSSLIKEGGKSTWWNNFDNITDVFYLEGTTYESISVSPPANSYFNSTTYYLPKKQF